MKLETVEAIELFHREFCRSYCKHYKLGKCKLKKAPATIIICPIPTWGKLNQYLLRIRVITNKLAKAQRIDDKLPQTGSVNELLEVE